MGIYITPKSPYYWMYLERPGARGTRESTGIPIRAPSQRVVRRNRRLAEDLHAIRLGEMARDRLLMERGTKTVSTTERPVPPPPPLTEEGWCYIYFIQREGVVKIGKTTNVAKRLEALQTANCVNLTLLAAVPGHASLEQAIHKRFADLKQSGEWFHLGDELRDFIEAVNGGTNPVALLLGQ